jgi:hypothetical protein
MLTVIARSGRALPEPADYIFVLYTARFEAQAVYPKEGDFLWMINSSTSNSPNEGEGNKTSAPQRW